MIELVAARGYEAGTVAELCALAGVSKRTLYERFPGGKQECFIATYDTIVHQAQRRILFAGRRGPDALERARSPRPLRALLQALAREVAAHPHAARLVVVEARHAGPLARARAVRTRRLVELSIAASLRESPDAPAPSPLVVRGIAAAGARVVRARLLDGRVAQLAGELPDLCLAVAAAPARAPDGRRYDRAARPIGPRGEKPSLALERSED